MDLQTDKCKQQDSFTGKLLAIKGHQQKNVGVDLVFWRQRDFSCVLGIRIALSIACSNIHKQQLGQSFTIFSQKVRQKFQPSQTETFSAVFVAAVR
jgi:hypothetical protein